MSGLEVAGIVLAVIPLFISALEHYEEGIRPFRTLKLIIYRQELSNYRAKLTTQYGMYSQSLEELLVDVVEEQELRDMIAHGYSPLWKKPEFEDRLKKRLGSIYEPYLVVMKQIQTVMAKIASLLDIQKQGNVTGPQLESLLLEHPPKHDPSQMAQKSSAYEFKKRLKFGFKSGQIQPLLDELARYNDALHRFTGSSRRLEEMRSTVSKSTFTTPLHRVRDCAEKLHRCLNGAWSCPHGADHVIDLQLESRISKLNTSQKDPEDRVIFTMAFSNILSSGRWHYLEMHVYNDSLEAVRSPGKVSFAQTTPAAVNMSSLPTITCLCGSISATQPQPSLGFCLDHQQRLLGNHPVLQKQVSSQRQRSASTTSLNDVLSNPATQGHRRPFSSKQAYLLGMIIASSFLQLRSTPWLCGSWRAGDVLFSYEDRTKLIDFDKPYIRQAHPGNQIPDPAAQAVGGADDADDNCSFLNLGIMLLEIFFREPIESHRSPGDCGSSRSFSDLQTARRWVQQDREEMPVGFYKAVAFCISCFASPNVDLRDTTFRQTVVDQVIVPLKDELKMWQT